MVCRKRQILFKKHLLVDNKWCRTENLNINNRIEDSKWGKLPLNVD